MPPRRRGGGGILIYPLSVRIQIHGLSGYSFGANILQDVYTHNGGVHVHRILIFIKCSQNDRQLDLVILFVRSDIDTWFVRLFPPTVLELQLYSFNICQNVYTHNGGVHVHRILIYCKYSQNDRQLDLVIFFVLAA